MSFLKKLLGGQSNKEESTTGSGQEPGAPEIVTRLREANKGKSLQELNDLYFDLMQRIDTAYKSDDFSTVLMHCQASLGLLEPLIQYTKQEYGSFDIQTIPALEYGLRFFAVSGNIGQLKNIQDIVDYFEELHSYKEDVENAFSRCDLAKEIYQYVKANPDCVQKDLKESLNFDDGNFIRYSVYYMEKMGRLTRTKKGNSYLLKIK